jgi:hypothetical protein
VVFSGVPELRLLVVNQQLHAEYLEAPLFKSVEARYEVDTKLNSRTFLGNKAGADRCYQQLLRRTSHITVLLKFDAAKSWSDLNWFSNSVMYNELQLLAIWITSTLHGSYASHYERKAETIWRVLSDKDRCRDSLPSFAGLPLTSYTRGLETCMDPRRPRFPERAGSVYHCLGMFSEWSFGAPSTTGASLELRSMEKRGYRQDVQAMMSEKEREDVEAWSSWY